tara:strand:+ start:344 stop:544 length:201 start_codon:yes stop_codon:yes gene_type:complete
MQLKEEFLTRLALVMQELGVASSDELEICTGGKSIYEGVADRHKNGFIIIRRPSTVVLKKSSNDNT